MIFEDASLTPDLDAYVTPLGVDSVLGELQLHTLQLDMQIPGHEAAQQFEQSPALPGIILTNQGQFVGMLSRSRFLEYLLRPGGTELFWDHPLKVLYSYARTQLLILPETTSILIAAQKALRRSPDLQGDPIVVRQDENFGLLNIHDLHIAHWQIRGIETQIRYERIQARMLQSEKMASLGRLVDGVAHEILDPVSFIWGNLSHVAHYSQQLLALLCAYQAELPETPPALIDLQDEIELDYLKSDLPSAIKSIQSGAERLKQLATSLQNFCHIDEVYPKPTDLHELIDSILLLLKSQINTRIKTVRHYGHLPPIPCYSGQLSQVFMNILSNAVDRLLEQTIRRDMSAPFQSPQDLGTSPPDTPTITITTQLYSETATNPTMTDQRWVSITIADNAPSLSSEHHQSIINSFSIEQRILKETSLAMSYRIITAKHGGRFHMRSHSKAEDPSDSAQGIEFEICLPLQPHLPSS